MSELKDEDLRRILKAFKIRVDSFGIKYPSNKYMDEQASFFSGVLIALNSTDPRLYIPVMSGRDILESNKKLLND